jgi:hypothetical protein
VPVAPNTQYDLYAHLRGQLAAASSAGVWIVRAHFYNEAGQYLGYQDIASGDDTTVTAAWQQRGGRISTPTHTTQLRIELFNVLTSGWVGFDDVSLYKVEGGSITGPNLAPSPGFEVETDAVLSAYTTATSTRYYYAGGVRVASRTGSGSGATGLVWLLGDHLGSTSVTAQGSSGALVARNLYKPWGELRAGAATSGFLYTGQRWEEAAGLYDYYGVLKKA